MKRKTDERPGRSGPRKGTAGGTAVATPPAPTTMTQPPPPRGSARWVRDEYMTITSYRADGARVVHTYLVKAGPEQFDLFRLDVKTMTVVHYTVRRRGGPAWWRCDCPDATGRGRECKHVLSLRALGVK